MNIQDFLGISIVGTGLSYAIQFLKAKFGTDSSKTKLMTVALSVVVGSVYYFFRDTTIWTSIIGVLAAASTVYALFLK